MITWAATTYITAQNIINCYWYILDVPCTIRTSVAMLWESKKNSILQINWQTLRHQKVEDILKSDSLLWSKYSIDVCIRNM